MKPESAAFFAKSQAFLVKARGMLASQWPDEAGRAAYFAGLHAARAFIFERSGEITKSHRRVQGEFGRLTKDDPRFDPDLRAFLGRAFNLKVLADYETGPDSEVSADRVREEIAMAARLVECVSGVIATDGDTPCAPEVPPKP